MSKFVYLNTNPEHHDTDDCTVRAISLFLGKSWDEVFLGVCAEGFIQKRMPSTDLVWKRYLERNDCYMTRVPSNCPMCFSVKDFVREYNKGRYLLKVDNHVVCVIDGYYYDTWNSGDEIVLYYWKRR